MITFPIDTTVIKKLKDLGLNSENLGSALIALIALDKNDIELLDLLDDHSSCRRAFILYQSLVRLGLLEANDQGDTYYKVTEEGKKLIEFIQDQGKQPTLKVIPWIQEWVDLFPDNVKSGGKPIKSDVKSCTNKMVQFLKDYPKYRKKELIFQATNNYLTEREKNGWEYTRCAIYFINKKGEGSDLATWCEEALKESIVEEVQTGMI